jgi:hypothetical protein
MTELPGALAVIVAGFVDGADKVGLFPPMDSRAESRTELSPPPQAKIATEITHKRSLNIELFISNLNFCDAKVQFI